MVICAFTGKSVGNDITLSLNEDRYAGAIGTWTPGHCDADGTAAWNFNFGPGTKLWFFISKKGREQLAQLGK